MRGNNCSMKYTSVGCWGKNPVSQVRCVVDDATHSWWCYLMNVVDVRCLSPAQLQVSVVCSMCVSCWRCVGQNKEKPLSKLLQRGEDVVFDQVKVCCLRLWLTYCIPSSLLTHTWSIMNSVCLSYWCQTYFWQCGNCCESCNVYIVMHREF